MCIALAEKSSLVPSGPGIPEEVKVCAGSAKSLPATSSAAPRGKKTSPSRKLKILAREKVIGDSDTQRNELLSLKRKDTPSEAKSGHPDSKRMALADTTNLLKSAEVAEQPRREL